MVIFIGFSMFGPMVCPTSEDSTGWSDARTSFDCPPGIWEICVVLGEIWEEINILMGSALPVNTISPFHPAMQTIASPNTIRIYPVIFSIIPL